MDIEKSKILIRKSKFFKISKIMFLVFLDDLEHFSDFGHSKNIFSIFPRFFAFPFGAPALQGCL